MEQSVAESRGCAGEDDNWCQGITESEVTGGDQVYGNL